MSPPSPSHAGADSNLLVGILALQMNFVSRDQLIAGMQSWVFDKARPLGQILLDQGALHADTHALLKALVQKHLDLHGNDAGQSLAAVSSVGSVRDELKQIADPDVQASLARVSAGGPREEDRTGPSPAYVAPLTPWGSVGRPSGEDPDATTAPRAVMPTSSGLRFRILRLHAKGGLGLVYVAHDEELHREVALKEIQDRHADHPESRSRFLLEAEITGRLEHPGIVPVYGLGTYADGRPFYVMRFVRGDSLKDAIERFHKADVPSRDSSERTLELRKLLGRFVDVCNAIAYAHSRGVLHRDLKPGNVMLGQYGETLVVDWGLAKPVGRSKESPPSDEGTIRPASASGSAPTQMGSAIGTPQYMSPEQAAGKLDQLGTASDVYSLGATLYCLLTGRAPLEGHEVGEVLRKVQRGEFPPPRQVKPAVPPALEAVCLQAMATAPVDRYPSPLALAEEIEHWLAEEPVRAYPESWPQKLARWSRRHGAWVRAGAVTLLLATLMTFGAAFLIHRAWNQEQAARKNEHAQRLRAEEQRRQAQQVSARLALDRGLGLCQGGDPAAGMLWLAHSLETAPGDDPDLHFAIRANLRGWYAEVNGLRAVLPQADNVRAIAFSRDGRTVLTGSSDGSAQLWEAATGRRLGDPLRQRQVLAGVAFRPNGLPVVVGVVDNSAQILEAATGKALGKRVRHAGRIMAACSPDGQRLLTGSADRTAQLWDAVTGERIGRPLRHEEAVVAVAFSPDGKTLLTAGMDQAVRRWDAATGGEIGEPLRHPQVVYAVAMAPDGHTVLTGSEDGQARVWEADAGKLLGPPLPHRGSVWAVAFSPDGQTALTGSADMTARLWDVQTGQPIGQPLGHRDEVRAVAFSPDGKLAGTGSYDQTARLWEVAAGPPLAASLPHHGPVRVVAFSPDGRTALTGSDDQAARLWLVATGQPLSSPLPHDAEVRAAAFSADGRWFVTASAAGAAQLWEAATQQPLGWTLRHQGAVNAVAFSPDSHTLLTGGEDHTAQLWDSLTGKHLHTLPHEDQVRTVAFSPDGHTVATASLDCTARLWDTDTGTPRGPPLRHRGIVWAVAFSPGGQALLTGSEDHMGRLWETATGQPIGRALLHQDAVRTVAYSPDGRTVLTGSWDRTARLWSASTGRPVVGPLAHAREVLAVAFSPDGKVLLTGSGDQAARFWDSALGQPIGPPLRHRDTVLAVVFSPDGRMALTGSSDGQAQLWKTPAPLTGEPEQIVSWVQAITGLELDRDGAVSPLDEASWAGLRRRLEELGGRPLP